MWRIHRLEDLYGKDVQLFPFVDQLNYPHLELHFTAKDFTWLTHKFQHDSAFIRCPLRTLATCCGSFIFWFLAVKLTRHLVTVTVRITIETKWNLFRPISVLFLPSHTHVHILQWNWICAVLEEGLCSSVPRICGFQYKSLAGKEAFSLWPAATQHQSLFHNNMLHLFSQHYPTTVKPGPKARHIKFTTCVM